MPNLANALLFDSDKLAAGQVWRPFTAWLVQANWVHWLLNQWGLVLMLILLPKQLSMLDVLGFVWVWLMSSIALWLSDYQYYVGLSGLLYGWLLISAACSPFYSRTMRVVFMVVLSIKVLSENGLMWVNVAPSWVEQWIGIQVATDSHLWGLMAGALFIVVRSVVRPYP